MRAKRDHVWDNTGKAYGFSFRAEKTEHDLNKELLYINSSRITPLENFVGTAATSAYRHTLSFCWG